MTTLRRLFVAAALAARPALPLAAATLTVAACGGSSTKKAKKPTPKPDQVSVVAVLQLISPLSKGSALITIALEQ